MNRIASLQKQVKDLQAVLCTRNELTSRELHAALAKKLEAAQGA